MTVSRVDTGAAPEVGARPGRGRKLLRYLVQQRAIFHGRLAVVQLLVRLIPFAMLDRLRGVAYRLAGFDVGHRVRIAGPLSIWGAGDVYRRLSIGEATFVNSPAHVELNAEVRIGARCAIGHHFVVITSNHVMGPASARAGAQVLAPVSIGDGVWIGACVTLLPGITIGDGAFVAAGAVVTRDVPPNARVAGNPAVVVGMLGDGAPPPRRPRPPAVPA